MHGARSLPLPAGFQRAEDYVDSLLNFTTSSDLFQRLCGGVHILDFFTKDPDVYASLLPASWREWFRISPVEEILDVLMRRDLGAPFSAPTTAPPPDLLDYIKEVRRHLLDRDYLSGRVSYGSNEGAEDKGDGDDVEKGTTRQRAGEQPLACSVAVGMKPKKKHEVGYFAAFVSHVASQNAITQLVDFGSGQSYLGRALASQPHNRDVIAVESKEDNIQGARRMDLKAKLHKEIHCSGSLLKPASPAHTAYAGARVGETSPENPAEEHGMGTARAVQGNGTEGRQQSGKDRRGSLYYVKHNIENGDLGFLAHTLREPLNMCYSTNGGSEQTKTRDTDTNRGKARLDDGGSSKGYAETRQATTSSDKAEPPMPFPLAMMRPSPRVMVISLHSCGNLIHHGLRSLVMNDFVTAVALVGCCYNLMTERLGPPTFKLPALRFHNARLAQEEAACDPHGFPLSQRFAAFPHRGGPGIRFNITARSMAVQAPQNWTAADSDAFFTRHFFRALLQRIFFDRGVVRATHDDDNDGAMAGGSGGGTEPIIIGSLRKNCYSSFKAYVRGAMDKLAGDLARGPHIQACMGSLTDEDIESYEQKYAGRRKDLSIVWSLMAFSAGLVEASIVVDRWLYLNEQQRVEQCWVEPVFDYRQSPRNLVVVGIKGA